MDLVFFVITFASGFGAGVVAGMVAVALRNRPTVVHNNLAIDPRRSFSHTSPPPLTDPPGPQGE